MAEGLRLFGYGPSVYTRIVRMGLIEMGLVAEYTEVDPFGQSPDPLLSALSPFGRVPVVQHAEFTLTETAAILRYLDRISTGPSLVPQDPRAAAQMAQVIGIVDFYGYVPLVRDVFAHGYYYAHVGETPDPARLQSGLQDAQPVLQALNAIAKEGRVLAKQHFSLADIHLAPMMAYFNKVPAGAEALTHFPNVQRWWDAAQNRPSLVATDPRAHQ